MKDNTIYYYRKKLDISQQKLAKLLNLPRTTISFFETKKQYPDKKTAEKIAKILKVPVGAIWHEYELELILEKSK